MIGPGDLYSSIIPNLLVRGVPEAIRDCKGTRIFVCNIMTKHGETDGFAASRFVSEVCRYLGSPLALDWTVINSKVPSAALQKLYAAENQLTTLPESLGELCDLPMGLVLVTGPTGSGKSTTLAAMVDHKNSNEYGHILTVEDPIEFVHDSKKCLINQREVHRDTLGFNEALRSALREDPDTILVGEMRDLETIRLALTAAETGHLVFGTLHTSSAAKTIDRVVDVFPAAEKDMVRAMLSESLRSVISQTLLKKNGGGRVAAHEIMVGTPAIRNLIRENKIAQMYSAIQTGQQYGMMTLDQTLQGLVQQGVISRQQAQLKATNKDSIA